MKTVDYFIFGAPKCGTTAIASTISLNPSVVLSSRKEPHHFSTDFLYLRPSLPSNEDYLSTYFPQEKALGDVWGDASVWHLFSTVAAAKVRAFNPNARIIVILRDPAKAAYSLHQMRRAQQHEPVRNFVEAWKMSQVRFDREGFDGFTDQVGLDPRLMAYRHAYTLHPQLTRLYETFPADQILVLRHKDLLQDGPATLKMVNEFIGGEKFDFPSPQKINSNLYMRDSFLVDLLQTKFVRNTVRDFKALFKIKSLGIGKPTVKMTAADMEIVRRDLASDVQAVKRDFGISLLDS
ncbi:sulfotransferase [uncultured Martelella sp.]|uniref:sulfotransferase n=1 Tax=uncultured Martelella sp. TaxID=392331 RepID=UPI0029C88676|nr:sulfotransferase [uncultured Martelella sp.]